MAILMTKTDSESTVGVITKDGPSWYFVFFLISGFCGLVYEVVWVRLAMASFGVNTALVSLVISTFMAGLGLGSWGGGRLAHRSSSERGLLMIRVYAAVELLTSISCLAVPFELGIGRHLLLHLGSAWQSSTYYALAGLCIAVCLLPWCTLMGATFPLLMAVIRQSDHPGSEHSFSYLYVANVMGALFGSLASAFVLIELFGFQGTLYVAGGLNALLALAALAISHRVAVSERAGKPFPRLPRLHLHTPSEKFILLYLFTTGFVSMGMEVVWIRQFTPYLGNVVYALAAILAMYLLATNMGSKTYRVRGRVGREIDSASAWCLLAFSTAIPVMAADPILTFGGLQAGRVHALLCLFSLVCFCAVLGVLTPLLVDLWSSGDPDRAGTAYAVNISGCIVGPLIAGFWLLPRLGERWSCAVLSIPLFVIAALALRRKPIQARDSGSKTNHKVQFALAVAGTMLLVLISHDYETQFTHRAVRRDYTATVVAAGTGFDRTLLVNGAGMTQLTPITKYMAHLPLAYMKRPPRNGLVICFGMGTTFRSMLSWGIPTTAVDLVPSVPALFWYFHADARTLVRSPLSHIVIDDGRRYLDGSNEQYDVIVVDPPPPVEAPGSSLLYSLEFYSVVKKHLRRDGILQIWYPEEIGDAATTASITKALTESFPYVRAFISYDGRYGIHFLASPAPLPDTTGSVLASRMPSAAVADFLEWGPAGTVQRQFQLVLSHEIRIRDLLTKDSRVPAMRDDEPINEYFLLRRLFGFTR